ncbi:MAG TPA: helix-turn-helix transcriptional regulator [Polyangiaceae bacterium]
MNDSSLLDSDIDFAALGALLAKARREAGLRQTVAAERVRISERSMSRTETGERPPSTRELLAMLETYGGAAPETLLAIRRLARLDPEPPPAAPPVDARAELDAAVRAYAEDLDVTARRLRGVVALLLADIERLGTSLADARAMIAHSPKRRG